VAVAKEAAGVAGPSTPESRRKPGDQADLRRLDALQSPPRVDRGSSGGAGSSGSAAPPAALADRIAEALPEAVADGIPLADVLRRQLLEAPNVADEIETLRKERAAKRKEVQDASKKLRQVLPAQ